MEFMKSKPDKYFDLAIVDPPYGIGVSSQDNTKRGKLGSHYEKKEWDKEPPSNEYFEQLFRISKNQVIWGANHFIERIIKTVVAGLFGINATEKITMQIVKLLGLHLRPL